MRIRKAYFTLLFCMLCGAISAQDIMFKMTAETVNVKIEEVNDSIIKYRLSADPAGPVLEIPRKDVHMIKYSNGERQIITMLTGRQDPTKRNMVAARTSREYRVSRNS